MNLIVAVIPVGQRITALETHRLLLMLLSMCLLILWIFTIYYYRRKKKRTYGNLEVQKVASGDIYGKTESYFKGQDDERAAHHEGVGFADEVGLVAGGLLDGGDECAGGGDDVDGVAREIEALGGEPLLYVQTSPPEGTVVPAGPPSPRWCLIGASPTSASSGRPRGAARRAR